MTALCSINSSSVCKQKLKNNDWVTQMWQSVSVQTLSLFVTLSFLIIAVTHVCTIGMVINMWMTLSCNFCKGILLLLSEGVQPWLNGHIPLLCQFDSGQVTLPLDVCFLALYYIFIELFEFELVFRNFVFLNVYIIYMASISSSVTYKYGCFLMVCSLSNPLKPILFAYVLPKGTC